ncbi:hypothetical protein U3516DRAFT_759144 [Neocallimastix sp. 'constans']
MEQRLFNACRKDINKINLFNVYRNGNKNIVKYLIEHGIYIEHEVENDETSLFNAYRSINKNIVKYLIEYGANKNKNKQMTKSGESILLFDAYCLVEKYGAEMNKKNVKNELIENGADKDDKLLFYAYILLKYIIKKI